MSTRRKDCFYFCAKPGKLISICLLLLVSCAVQPSFRSSLIPVAEGWSATSVNAAIFRSNSIVSQSGFQFVAFYDSAARIVICKRKLGSTQWSVGQTKYTGNSADAHNMISIMIDGNGYLHMAWDQHGNDLNYCRSVEPLGLVMGEKESMTGTRETAVTYPEFYRVPSGDLIFIYRDGSSGNGNLVMNRYTMQTRKWERVHDNLVSGEGERNAYWQFHVSRAGVLHLSWVWRETSDVETNHDLCYAVSYDQGRTWTSSEHIPYSLPITLATAEYAARIPEESDLINQTSMVADSQEQPYIATYLQGEKDLCPQYYVFYKSGGRWKQTLVSERKTDFDLGGGGTRSIPISRPRIISYERKGSDYLGVIYRDEEFQNRPRIAFSKSLNFYWQHVTLIDHDVLRWEPTIDTELLRKGKLHLFFQKVGQGSGEKAIALDPQMISVLEVDIR
jgi:hypothetical protein